MAFKRSLLTIFFVVFALPVRAEVVRIDVASRTELLGGKEFGAAGVFEKLSGKIYFEVDPGNAANKIIADIKKAPKNDRGKVEFSSDFYMLKPFDAARGNGTVLFEVANRGTKSMLGFFNLASGNSVDPKTDADLGQPATTTQWGGKPCGWKHNHCHCSPDHSSESDIL